ncbi:6-pyruvoyl tetrahydropterin synthase [Prochlorococcus marinus str. MIT 9215]|uniref:6-carboxy-5,6,7,8-tetrahydropterin synthase n=1 Tax=Prochlorococcus marinus (strain MIT 9215) TaxID=93060 RepID=A8G2B1_PROM2|nr:6-carboxytetrahydropterin synthase [Prochlorococcus marinus]ABV49742.1 6-pyruvoyl tetrahydropterin synthase [Prochlorococcus marinus str. MIT 9215]
MTSPQSNSLHGKGRECVITRRACFSSSHRYWLPEKSPEENLSLFGKCSFAPGHGHNYELIVSMGGELDSDGMVLNLSDVKHSIKNEVTGQLDFRFLNDVWPEFNIYSQDGILPTTEALVKVIWNRLKDDLPLTSLRLYESPTLWADYFGTNMEALLTVQSHFNAAHRLAKDEISLSENKKIYGKCARINGHGHNYFLDVTVRGQINPRTGMICDLPSLQSIIDDLIVEQFDHTFLNKDIEYFKTCVPTCENIALHISDILSSPIKNIGANLHKIRLQESPNNAAEIYVEQTIQNSLQRKLENSLVAQA